MDLCIVGHGRSPEGKGWGRRIDACGAVLRMWDHQWQSPGDYGTRFDYGLFEAHPHMLAHFYRHKEREPTVHWVASVLGKVQKSKLPAGTVLVDQAPWTRMARAMGGIGATGFLQFTRGTIAACWALEYLLERGDTLILVGFDNVHRGETLSIEDGFSEAYKAEPSTSSFRGYIGNVVRYGNHDFSIEGPLLDQVAASKGVELHFAQDIWKC